MDSAEYRTGGDIEVNTKEKALTGAATSVRTAMETAAGKAAIPCYNNSTDVPNAQSIFDLLPRGEVNAVPSKTLAELSGCRSVRELQYRIAAERKDHLILSTCRNGGGYYAPARGKAGRAEITAFISTLRNRALNTLAALKTAQAALQEMDHEVEGQLTLDGLEDLL